MVMTRKLFITASILFIIRICFAGNPTDSIRLKVNSEGFNLDALVVKKRGLSQPMPAIIFLVGSSGNSSHRTNYKDFNTFFFDSVFVENGFVMVYFDKRGVGNSEGKWYETTFEERALDARSVALALRQVPFVDSTQIFVVGHSQGGWISQIAVAQYPDVFAAGVSMAGPAFGVRRQLVNDYQSRIICVKGFSNERALKIARRKVKRDLFFVSLFGRRGDWRQLTVIKTFEPAPFLASMKKPLLMVLGEHDELVSLEWCKEELSKVGSSNILVYIAEGENHSFKVAPRCYTGKSSALSYSKATRDKIYEWITSQLK